MTITAQNNGLLRATEENPCPHCGKPDWCYFIGELTCCKRGNDPATGWEKTGKTDKDGAAYYAPVREKKAVRPKDKRVWEYLDRGDNRFVRVVRTDDGNGKRKVWQERWNKTLNKWVKGLDGINREDIPIYRLDDVHEYIQAGEAIYIVEGESCADALWKLGLPATTNIGGAGKWKHSDFEDLQGAEVVICPDRDKPGLEHALTIAEYFPNAKWLIPYPDSPVWQSLPDSGGLDIVDWISDFHIIKREELEILIKEELPLSSRLRAGAKEEEKENLDRPYHEDDTPVQIPTAYFTQKAYSELYECGRFISFGGNLYQWVGTHYKLCSQAEEKYRIQQWLNSHIEWTPRGPKYSRANSCSIEEVWKWTLAATGVDIDSLNPPGINCKNGILRIEWKHGESKVPEVEYHLHPHSPDEYYTYVSGVSYSPGADPSHCDRLLECLDAPQRKVFLQVIAAALDLQTVRRYCGRMVKLLLLWGEGANGKDTLREAVAAIFASGLSGASLSDFQAYDGGRKFPLSKLAGSLINWASENTKFAALDTIQSIKQFATGDPIYIELKRRDEYQINPKAVGLFNCNEPPSIRGGMEAVTSRWAIIRFTKVFKREADPTKGELEADPRFKYDPDFLRDEVAPALLNKLLDELKTLISDGIDYTTCQEGFHSIQEETCHLWTFCREKGIEYSPGERIYVGDLWEDLKSWYLEDGTLEIDEGGRQVWNELPRKGDRLVKGPNQIRVRFTELFPKITFGKETVDRERRNQLYLFNLCKKINKSENCLVASHSAQGEDYSLDNCLATASLDKAVGKPVARQLRGSSKIEALHSNGCEATSQFAPNFDLINFARSLGDDDQAKLLSAIAEAQKFKERVAGLTELLKDAVKERLDYELVRDLTAGISDDERKAVWEGLTELERQYLTCVKSCADFPAGTKVKDRADGRFGTVTSVHIYRLKGSARGSSDSYLTKVKVLWEGDLSDERWNAVELLERVEN